MFSADLAIRVRAEFCEMPGLKLTVAQAARLWQLDRSTCEAILTSLVSERFLDRAPNGHYVALPALRARARTVPQLTLA